MLFRYALELITNSARTSNVQCSIINWTELVATNWWWYSNSKLHLKGLYSARLFRTVANSPLCCGCLMLFVCLFICLFVCLFHDHSFNGSIRQSVSASVNKSTPHECMKCWKVQRSKKKKKEKFQKKLKLKNSFVYEIPSCSAPLSLCCTRYVVGWCLLCYVECCTAVLKLFCFEIQKWKKQN